MVILDINIIIDYDILNSVNELTEVFAGRILEDTEAEFRDDGQDMIKYICLY